MSYSVDASALIDGWVRYYPPDVLPSLWTNMATLISSGSVRAPLDVKFELERGGDDLYDWACSQQPLFVETSPELEEHVREIVNRFPAFVPERASDGIWADPYVIALARVDGHVVVTGEVLASTSARHPKIPNICDAYGIECINLLELIRRERWTF